MGANSGTRKLAKAILYPLTNERSYKYIQAVSKALDIKKRTWDEPELELIPLGLREGEIGLDIGANYGIYAYHMSKAVGRTGKVFSFEPVPFTFATLKIVGKLLGFSKNVEFVEKGCSDENRKITFSVPVQSSGALAAGQAYIGKRNDDHTGKEDQVKWTDVADVTAEVVRLDDFMPDVGDIPLVKADIEGAELLCFRGGDGLFTKHLPTTICEINPWFLAGFGIKLEDLTSFFFEKGYQMYSYSNVNGKPRLEQAEVADVVEDNYVFIHPSRADRFSALF